MSKLYITIIQSDIHWQNIDANLEMFAIKIENISNKTEIILLPEMFTTGFTMEAKKFAETMEGKTMTWLKNISAKKRAIISGSFIVVENDNFFNRLVWMQPDGKYFFYDKKHLFTLAKENETFTAGNKKLIVSVNGFKICPLICYDLRFPVWARQQKNIEYDVLIYIASWPQKRILAWDTLLKARAIENQSFVIGVNRVGIDGNNMDYNGKSTVINPLGEIIYLQENDEDIITIIIDKDEIEQTRKAIPFLEDIDTFELL